MIKPLIYCGGFFVQIKTIQYNISPSKSVFFHIKCDQKTKEGEENEIRTNFYHE